MITHYHAELAARLPVCNFVDHGASFETGKAEHRLYDEYVRVRANGNHLVVKAGDRIPIKGCRWTW